MKYQDALDRLLKLDRKQQKYVYDVPDLRTIFHEDNDRTLIATCQRLIENGALRRAANGVFVFSHTRREDGRTAERIANVLRRGEYNYLSLESALSEYGVISQIPVGRITVMTTGRKGTFDTPYGTIELTHTKRSVGDILSTTMNADRPLRLATVEQALADLKRVNRNLHLVSYDDYEEVLADAAQPS